MIPFLVVTCIDTLIWFGLYCLWSLALGNWNMETWQAGDELTYWVACGIEGVISLFIMDYYDE